MRLSDPRWPAVRELARILLRTDELTVQGPHWLEASIQQLSLRLADVQPARRTFPAFALGKNDAITLVTPAPSVMVGRCSLDEPGAETVWLPMAPIDAWAAISKITDDLLAAGYPGCLGCGGPHTEGDWDEISSRLNMVNNPQDGS